MKTYKVTCQVAEDQLHGLIRHFEAMGVTGFSVNLQQPAAMPAAAAAAVRPQPAARPVEAPIAARPKPVKHLKFRYVGGKKNKGVSAQDLVLHVLNTSPNAIVTCQELRSEFVKHGFSKTSISSPLSVLTRERRIVHVGEASYARRSRYVEPMANGAAQTQ